MSNITLTIPNDDHIALRAFGKALEEMALAHGAEPRKTIGEMTYKLNIDTTEATAALERLQPATEEDMKRMRETCEIDTTPQQVESLSVSMGDNESPEEFLQRYDESEPVHDDEQAPPTTDSTGTPWDERIHSTSKALNADGTWRLRRKPKDMDEAEWAALIESVKGELSGNTVAKDVQDEIMLQKWDELEHHMSIEPTREEVDELIEASNKMLEPPVTPPGDDYHTDTDVVTEQTVAGIPPLPVPPPVVVAPPVPVQAALSEGIARYGDAMSELAKNDGDVQWDFPRLMTFLTERHGKIDVATVNTLLAQDGMSSVQELNAHPDKIGPFVARVKAHLGE